MITTRDLERRVKKLQCLSTTSRKYHSARLMTGGCIRIALHNFSIFFNNVNLSRMVFLIVENFLIMCKISKKVGFLIMFIIFKMGTHF